MDLDLAEWNLGKCAFDFISWITMVTVQYKSSKPNIVPSSEQDVEVSFQHLRGDQGRGAVHQGGDAARADPSGRGKGQLRQAGEDRREGDVES